ncbi:hypothetical protein [uncultured Kordia sp.]|uniref:hypothetical protein n=1 Tax=uncultured Kordia sp. TaxID=507699 RepID=UPI00260C1867|nr:hypothetical protein [uncultured Kordia sp.]
MKVIQKITPFCILILLISCSSPERKGLSTVNRSYIADAANYSCEDEIKYLSQGMIIALENLSLDAIYTKATSQLDHVLGNEFISTSQKQEIKEKLTESYFTLEKKIQDKTIMIGSNNLWEIKNPKEFFKNNTIYPRDLNWQKMITCNFFEPLTFEKTIGKWTIKQTIVPCVGPNWSETGQFKKVEKINNETNIYAEFQYQLELNIIIHLTVTNTENSKQEYYTTTLSDKPKGYTISNLSTRYALEGIEVPNPSNNEHRKIKVMSTITTK